MTNWFLTPKKIQDVKHRLFCFPYAGGNAASYIPWAQSLTEGIELVAIQPPGRSNHIAEKPCDSMGKLVRMLHSEIDEKIHQTPFSFFGHSLGARVAYELTKRLERLGKPIPESLCVSASRAPHHSTLKNPSHTLPDKQFIEKMMRIGGLPVHITENKDQLDLHLPALRADFKIVDTYTSKIQCISSPIHCLYSQEDTLITPQDSLDWKHYTESQFKSYQVPGSHLYIDTNKEPIISLINKIIS